MEFKLHTFKYFHRRLFLLLKLWFWGESVEEQVIIVEIWNVIFHCKEETSKSGGRAQMLSNKNRVQLSQKGCSETKGTVALVSQRNQIWGQHHCKPEDELTHSIRLWEYLKSMCIKQWVGNSSKVLLAQSCEGSAWPKSIPGHRLGVSLEVQ